MDNEKNSEKSTVEILKQIRMGQASLEQSIMWFGGIGGSGVKAYDCIERIHEDSQTIIRGLKLLEGEEKIQNRAKSMILASLKTDRHGRFRE